MENNREYENLQLKYTFNIINDSYVKGILKDNFIVFNTINDLSYIVYSSKYALINCYDINNYQKVCEIKEDEINSFKYVNFNHFFDKKNKRDLVLSIYCKWDTLKLWDVKNWECLLILNNINDDLSLGYCCFLEENIIKDNLKQNLYIITSCRDNKNGSKPIKAYDLNGKIIKEIKNSENASMFIKSYFDKKNNKNYIISCNMNSIKSYDFEENQIYHEYFDKKENELYNRAIIYENDKTITLITSCFDGAIRFWDFHKNIFLKKIIVNSSMLFDCTVWNDEYLFAGNEKLNLINLKTGDIKFFSQHKNEVINIKIINHKNYGKCLISQGKNYDRIMLWIFENK